MTRMERISQSASADAGNARSGGRQLAGAREPRLRGQFRTHWCTIVARKPRSGGRKPAMRIGGRTCQGASAIIQEAADCVWGRPAVAIALRSPRRANVRRSFAGNTRLCSVEVALWPQANLARQERRASVHRAAMTRMERISQSASADAGNARSGGRQPAVAREPRLRGQFRTHWCTIVARKPRSGGRQPAVRIGGRTCQGASAIIQEAADCVWGRPAVAIALRSPRRANARRSFAGNTRLSSVEVALWPQANLARQERRASVHRADRGTGLRTSAASVMHVRACTGAAG